MNIRPIITDADYEVAVQEIKRLWGATEGSADGEKLEVLATLVDAYEAKRWPSSSSTPTEILQYAISEMGRSQKELADLLKSRSQASELLSGKRQISLEVARKVSAAWNIPIQLLVSSPATKKAMSL